MLWGKGKGQLSVVGEGKESRIWWAWRLGNSESDWAGAPTNHSTPCRNDWSKMNIDKDQSKCPNSTNRCTDPKPTNPGPGMHIKRGFSVHEELFFFHFLFWAVWGLFLSVLLRAVVWGSGLIPDPLFSPAVDFNKREPFSTLEIWPRSLFITSWGLARETATTLRRSGVAWNPGRRVQPHFFLAARIWTTSDRGGGGAPTPEVGGNSSSSKEVSPPRGSEGGSWGGFS